MFCDLVDIFFDKNPPTFMLLSGSIMRKSKVDSSANIFIREWNRILSFHSCKNNKLQQTICIFLLAEAKKEWAA